MKQGVYHDFYLAFKTTQRVEVPSETQARMILDEARSLIAAGAVGVDITYSANHQQTLAIAKAYSAGRYKAGISGANQAEVMTALEALLRDEYRDLQGKMRIAPITTLGYINAEALTIVKADLANIRDMLEQGWHILGWKNQTTGNNYAVGGGIVRNLPTLINNEIQNTLHSLAARYKYKPLADHSL